MHLFTDYLQPLTVWLYANPHWALLITFLISLSESLALVGTLIPGTVTMTAIGILAGSGVMRVDLTILAAILGAIAGDSASYALGYRFRNQLVTIWPFSRYPTWLGYGKAYFAKHGGKSVLIGRFTGPLRSIIPLIAGMMHMNRWHFLVANVLSAIGWAVLYLVPGVLIGAASSELSPESASRLFLIILILLAIIWIGTIAIKWLIRSLNRLMSVNFHRFWLWSKDHPQLAYYFNLLTPRHEINHYPTASLILLLCINFIISTFITMIVIQGNWVQEINEPVYLILQSLRTNAFDVFFIIISLFFKPLAIIALITPVVAYQIVTRQWRMLYYWISLVVFSSIFSLCIAYAVNIPEPELPIKQEIQFFYPAICLTFATALFGFLIFSISTNISRHLVRLIKVILIGLLIIEGIGIIYLGDNWLTSVLGGYFIGLTICLGHWILYRRNIKNGTDSQLIYVLSLVFILLTALITYKIDFKTLTRSHHLIIEQYVIDEPSWWGQTQPILPLYTKNRVGQHTGLFNIQYAGSIERLQKALVQKGWKNQPNSFFYTLLVRAGGKKLDSLPLLSQLYHNKKPRLVMTYSLPNKKRIFVLQIWRSNYHLSEYNQPIWLGSIKPHLPSSNSIRPYHSKMQNNELFDPVVLGMDTIISITIPLNKKIKPLSNQVVPAILLIKEKQI